MSSLRPDLRAAADAVAHRTRRVLAAYRVGDSPVNSITPLNAYFAMIVTFAQRYQKDAGVGTVIALMLPYVLILSAVWTIFLAIWQIAGLPWGL